MGAVEGKGCFVESADVRTDRGTESFHHTKKEYWLDQEQLEKEHRLYRVMRRVQDVFFSLLALIVLAIPMLVVALVIWIDSPGASPLFRQDRLGRNGKRFKLYKFRSMTPDAEKKLEEFLEQNEMDGPVFKIKDDPRITRVGRVIRKTSIDELPQLINVLKGDMSIVGPRPPLPQEAAQYTAYQKQRLYVKPGLTCYWQVQPDRNKLPFDAWVNLDLKYIQDRSFLLDWKLIFLTIVAMVRMYGE